jgi:hypothetical protein
MAGEDWTPPGGSTHVFRVPTYDDAADAPNAFKEFATSIDGGLGLDFEADREGQVVQSLDGVDWAAGMALTVSETVPEDSVGEIGDVVFVTGDDDLKGSGAGSAVVSGHKGANYEPSKVIDGETYDIYTFTDDTRNDLSLTVDTPGFIDVLVVGGGGGGGAAQCGGGGAGQFFEYRAYTDSGNFPVTVGSGGSGMPSSSLLGSAGTQSGFNLYWAVGGGESQGRSNAGDGGSGAGAGDITNDAFGVTTAGGQNGGRGGGQCGGGGGGALLPGQDGSDSSTRKGGDGGDGRESLITGTSVILAGGGGGHGVFDVGKGGAGGGGNGTTGVGENGATNTGSGGGAGETGGGAGGSGIVIVRVKV